MAGVPMCRLLPMRTKAVEAMTVQGYHLGPGHLLTSDALQWGIRFHVEPNADDHLTAPGKTAAHLRCATCGQSVACLTPDIDLGTYALTAQIIVSGIIAHLKISHEDALTPV